MNNRLLFLITKLYKACINYYILFGNFMSVSELDFTLSLEDEVKTNIFREENYWHQLQT